MLSSSLTNTAKPLSVILVALRDKCFKGGLLLPPIALYLSVSPTEIKLRPASPILVLSSIRVSNLFYVFTFLMKVAIYSAAFERSSFPEKSM